MDTIENKLKRVRLLLLDVDGVLTDGRIVYTDEGAEVKHFNVRDGLGIRMLLDAGIPVGIVTGRRSAALMHRCRDLGIEFVLDGVGDKAAVMDRIAKDTGVAPAETAFMGDDLPDIPLMRRVGVSVAVADAHEEVLAEADMRTAAPGGAGAVREFCERLLAAQGLWQLQVQKFCR